MNKAIAGFIAKVVAFITVILVATAILVSCSSGTGKSSSKRKTWEDLNDQEKANARWAYEAQQAIKGEKY